MVRPKHKVRLVGGGRQPPRQPKVRLNSKKGSPKPGRKWNSGSKPSVQRQSKARRGTSVQTVAPRPVVSGSPNRSKSQTSTRDQSRNRQRTPPAPVTSHPCPPGSYLETEVLEILLELDDQAGEGSRPVPNVRTKSPRRKKKPSMQKRLSPTSSLPSTERPQQSLPSRDQGAKSRRQQRGR